MAYKVSDQELGLSMVFYCFWPPKYSKIFFFFLGLFPDESYDEWVADMICDGVKDLITILVKIFHEKDETKKVYLVEPMFLCILRLRMFTVRGDLGGFWGALVKSPHKEQQQSFIRLQLGNC